jgi:hypothetical protein
MPDILPPAPVDAPFGAYNWVDWYKKVRDAINAAETIVWTAITGTPTTLAGYGITDGQTKLNNSAGLAAALSDETGTGLAVFNNTPTLVTPETDILTFEKAAGNGIKVDTTTPTYPWHDMLGTIDVRGIGGNDPAWAVFRNGIRAYQFGINDECWVVFHLLHDYVPGTDIYLHTHWAHNSAAVASGSVTWSFECTYAKGHNQAAFPATVTTTVTQSASTTQYQHMIAETVISTAGGSATLLDSSTFETDGLIMVRCSLTGNTMSAATDPFLFLLDCHYQSTGIGTKQKAPNFFV